MWLAKRTGSPTAGPGPGSRPRADRRSTHRIGLSVVSLAERGTGDSPRAATCRHRATMQLHRRNRRTQVRPALTPSHPRSSRMASPKLHKFHTILACSARCCGAVARNRSTEENIWQFMAPKLVVDPRLLDTPSTTFSITAATLGGRSSINPGNHVYRSLRLGRRGSVDIEDCIRTPFYPWLNNDRRLPRRNTVGEPPRWCREVLL